ncbi:MAG TPA: BON domain-containing protein [Candidatus Limnocylindrales bacterium]|nr:BON domain-containing protein [Candidatus Limnocylindrales bacterium]
MYLGKKLKLWMVILVVWVMGVSCGLPQRTSQQVTADELITKRVQAKLAEVPLRPPPQDYLIVTTHLGVVHLRGVVEDQFTRNKILELAKSVEGVKEVTENIRIEPERGGGGGASTQQAAKTR